MAAPKDQQLAPETMDAIRLAVPFFRQELGEMGFVNIALYVLITTAATTLFAWWISTWFTQSRANFKNSIRLFGWWVGFALFGLLGGVLLFKVGYALGAVAFVLIMLLVGALAPPMKVYEFTVTKAAGFLACWIILNGIVQLLAGGLLTGGKGLPWTRLMGKSPGERLAFLRRELERDGSDSSTAKPNVAPSAKPIPAAAAAKPTSPPDLRAMYEALQKDREALDMNDREAVAAFNARAAEYKALVASRTPAAPSPSGSPAANSAPPRAGGPKAP